MKFNSAKNTNRSEQGRLLCERLAKAPKIPMKASSTTKTYRVNPRTESKKAIPIKAGGNVTTSTAKKTVAPTPAKIVEDGVKKAIREAVEAKARVLLNRRKEEMRIEELRRAAREALEKLELSVEVEDSHESVRALERICGGFRRNNLQSFGLCFKC